MLGISARFAAGGSSTAALTAKGDVGGCNQTTLWNVNQLGAGTQNWIGKVDFVTE